jgi:SAM-dependent methyltransferase
VRDFDYGRHTADYAEHRPGFPVSFYRRLDAIAPIAGSRAVDLATGPGKVALELAARGGRVVGIDVSRKQIATAERLARQRRLEADARFEVATAEDTGLEPGAFDLVTAGQCWHWFDGERVLAEAMRLLRPGGALAVAFYSYLAEHSPVAKATEELVLQFNPSWKMAGRTGISPRLVDELIVAGFVDVEEFGYHHDQPFSHSGWRGRIRTCNGVGSGGLSPEDVERFDARLARLLEERFPDPLIVEHRVWCVVGKKPT